MAAEGQTEKTERRRYATAANRGGREVEASVSTARRSGGKTEERTDIIDRAARATKTGRRKQIQVRVCESALLELSRTGRDLTKGIEVQNPGRGGLSSM